jgi:preprotein translocase subunit YajC
MGANLFLLAILAMFLAWFIYFKIQDRKEENHKQKK